MEQCNEPQWASEQLTQEEAIAFAKDGVWKDWTDEQIVRFQLFQKCLAMDFSRFHVAIEKVLGRSIFTHEFAFRDALVMEYLGEKPKPTIDEIIDLISAEKRIIINR